MKRLKKYNSILLLLNKIIINILENEKHAKVIKYKFKLYRYKRPNNKYIIFWKIYKTKKKIGEGSFRKVYKVEYNNKTYAMKLKSKRQSQGLLESDGIIIYI